MNKLQYQIEAFNSRVVRNSNVRVSRELGSNRITTKAQATNVFTLIATPIIMP